MNSPGEFDDFSISLIYYNIYINFKIYDFLMDIDEFSGCFYIF